MNVKNVKKSIVPIGMIIASVMKNERNSERTQIY